MFWHVFTYRLKLLVRDRSTLFWTLIFPLVIATLFYFSFGHLTTNYVQFEPIKTALIESESLQGDPAFLTMLQALAEPSKEQLLELSIVSEAEAMGLLETDQVSGVIGIGEELQLTIKYQGPKQIILKTILDEYEQNRRLLAELKEQNPGKNLAFLSAVDLTKDFTEQTFFSTAQPNFTLSYFYALIAMTCMYGSYWGIRNATHLQADQSPQGARRTIAPTNKLTIVYSDTLAALVLSFAEVLILLVYLRFALQISFGDQLWSILLIALVGCWAGVAIGGFIGTVVKGDQRFKSRVLLLVNNLTSIAAGLVSVNVKDTIAQEFPLLAYINPASLIADSFYSLYIYDSYKRVVINLAFLCSIALILSLSSLIYLRRERYASL